MKFNSQASVPAERLPVHPSDVMAAVLDETAELADLSARLGADRRLVQGGGGNTSLKQGRTLWVKASGTWLAEAKERRIFVPLGLAQVQAVLANGEGETEPQFLSDFSELRPSIETSLHALLPHAVVIHVHSVNVIARVVCEGGEADFADRLEGLRWSWIPYRRPGYPLTRAVEEVLDKQRRIPDVLVLANHGLVVGAKDCAAAEALLREVERRLDVRARTPLRANAQRLSAANDLGWRLAKSALVHALGTDAVTRAVARGGVLYPDHAVFLGERALVVEEGDSLSGAIAEFGTAGKAPLYAAVEGGGVLLAPVISKGAEAMLECLALVGLRLCDADSLRYLNGKDIAELAQWEAEAYRRAHDVAVHSA